MHNTSFLERFVINLFINLLTVAWSGNIFSLNRIKLKKKFADFQIFFRVFMKFYKTQQIFVRF